MRERINIRSFGAVLLFLLLASCSRSDVPAVPRLLSANQIVPTIRTLPKDISFGFSGVAFFKGKLYVSSNVGLLVVNGTKPEGFYSWIKRDDVIEGPWLDKANDALWIQHAHDDSLHRFDGSAWHRVELPIPPDGFTRGDILTGFLGISTPTAFWLVGGGHVWRLHSDRASWLTEPEPPAPKYSAIRAVAALNSSLLYIVREESEITPPSKYAVYNRENNWARDGLSEKMDFGGVVPSADGVYVRATEGTLFLIRPGNVEMVGTPGQCEAIAQTSTGKLLASFVDRGIFVREDGKWNLRAPYPYAKQEGEHWAYLAESNGQIAYATSSDSGSNSLWVQRADKLERVPFD